MNKVILIGTIDKNPELRFTQAGQAVLNMKVETKEEWVKDGVKKERKEWTSVVFWGKRAEELAPVLTHGVHVIVEGRIQTSNYDDKDGQKRYKTEVNASSVDAPFVQAPAQASFQQPNNPIPFGAAPPPAAPAYGGGTTDEYGDIRY